MPKVTIESLAQRIAELESRPRSLNEDYQLEAYRMLHRALQIPEVSDEDCYYDSYGHYPGYDWANGHNECRRRIHEDQ